MAALVCAVIGLSCDSSKKICRPGQTRCFGGTIQQCYQDSWVAWIDCASHSAACEEIGGEASCVPRAGDADSDSDADANAEPDGREEPDNDRDPEPEMEPEPDSLSEPDADSEPDTELELEPDVEEEAPVEPEAEAALEIAEGGETDADTDSDTYCDVDSDTNPVDWIEIVGGSFIMAYSNDVLAHSVGVPGFQLAKTEVMMSQYKVCVDEGVCTAPDEGRGCYWFAWHECHPLYRGQQPVSCVTWTQAKEYCEWIGARLPTEAEWEYAARSQGKEQGHPWGDENDSCDYAVLDNDPGLPIGEGCGELTPADVCSIPAGNSDQGVCDLLGNVWEWVEDDYHGDYSGAPDDGAAWIDEPRSPVRVIRGSGWRSTYAHAVVRGNVVPSTTAPDIGFRCARTDPEVEDEAADAEAEAEAEPEPETELESEPEPDAEADAETDPETTAQDGFVFVPAGTFWMGSPDGCPGPAGYPGNCTSELGRVVNEELHEVTLTRGFYIMAHEVSQYEFEAVMGWNESSFTSCGADCPVQGGSWFNAVAFANELSSRDGYDSCYVLSNVSCENGDGVAAYMDCFNPSSRGIDSVDVAVTGVSSVYDCEGYRLPTEAEWEMAARAGSNTAFHPSPGNDGSISQLASDPLDPNLDQIGWYGGNSSASYVGARDCTGRFSGATTCGPQPVGGKDANAWGLHDMSGNVSEWVWDWHGSYDGDETDPVGPGSGLRRVHRGGGWGSSATMCRSAFRYQSTPGVRGGQGFRLSRTASP